MSCTNSDVTCVYNLSEFSSEKVVACGVRCYKKRVAVIRDGIN